MKVEHGERRGRDCCLVSKGEGEKGKRERTQRVKPPFPSHRKKWKLVSLPGRVLLFWCFYSNSFYVPILPTCSYYYATCEKKKKNTQMPETIWLLVIRQRQTSLFNSPYCIYTVQADTHTLLQKQANTRVFHKFGMTRYAPSMGFLKKQEGQKGFNKKCDVQKQLHYDFYLCSSLINFFPYLSLCLSIPGSLCVLICTFPVYLFVYVCVVIYPVWSWHVVIFRKTDWDREALPRP